eukprot:TRINITY_DN426_c0_g1_i1.p1 TRINITY_DN426_c0_g1~~TRINITY_DN426_c0_g1_i1.p1  ORF type:complete len:1376 (-),score=268.62 TRINITY_DN426_c0_g1_i1:1007-5134(-)
MCIRDSINAEYGDFDCGQMTPRQCAGAIAASLMLGLVVADPVCDLVNNNQHHSNHDNGGYSKITNWCQDMNLAELGAWGSKVNATAIADGIPTRAGDPPWPVTCNYNLRWGHGPPYMVGSSGDLSLNARPYTVYQASNDPDGQPLRANLTCTYTSAPDQVHVLDKFNMGCAGFPVPMPKSLQRWHATPGETGNLVEEQWRSAEIQTGIATGVALAHSGVNVGISYYRFVRRGAEFKAATDAVRTAREADAAGTAAAGTAEKIASEQAVDAAQKALTEVEAKLAEQIGTEVAEDAIEVVDPLFGILFACLTMFDGVFGDAKAITELFKELVDWVENMVDSALEQENVSILYGKMNDITRAFGKLNQTAHALTVDQWVDQTRGIILNMELAESDLFLQDWFGKGGSAGKDSSTAIGFVSQWASLYLTGLYTIFMKQQSEVNLRAFGLGVAHWARVLRSTQANYVRARVSLITGSYCIQDTYGEGMQSMTLSHQHLDNSKVAAGYVTTLYKDVIGRTWRDFMAPGFEDAALKWERLLARIHNRQYLELCPAPNSSLVLCNFSMPLVVSEAHPSWHAARLACSNSSLCIGYGVSSGSHSSSPVYTYKTKPKILPSWGEKFPASQTVAATCRCFDDHLVGKLAHSFYGPVKYHPAMNVSMKSPEATPSTSWYQRFRRQVETTMEYVGGSRLEFLPWCRGINTSSLSTWIASVNTSEIELGIFAQPSAPRPTCQLDLLSGYGAAIYNAQQATVVLPAYTLHIQTTAIVQSRNASRAVDVGGLHTTKANTTTTRTWKIACYGHNLSVSDYNMNCAGFPVPPPNLIHSWHHGPPSIGLLVSESLKSVSAGVRVEVGIQLEDQVGAEAEAALSRLFEHVPRSEALQETLGMFEAVFGQGEQVSVSFQALTGWAGEFLGNAAAGDHNHRHVYSRIWGVVDAFRALQQTSSFLTNSSWASRARQVLQAMKQSEGQLFRPWPQGPTKVKSHTICSNQTSGSWHRLAAHDASCRASNATQAEMSISYTRSETARVAASFQSQWASLYLSTSLELYQKQPTFENLRLLGRDVYRWGQLLRKSQLELLQRRLAQIRSGDGQPFIQDQFARGMVSVWDDSPEAVALASNLAVLYKDVIGRTWLDQLFPRFEGLARQFEQVLSHIHNRMYYKPCPDTQHPTRSSYTFASATLVAASHHASWDAAEQACTTEDSCIGYGTDNKLVNPNSTLSIKTYTANRSLPAWGSSAASAMTLTWMCTTPKVGHVTSSNSSSESSFNSFFGAVKYRHEIRATEAVAPVISKAAKPTTQEPPSSSGSGLSMAWTVVIVVSGVAVLGAFTGWSVVTIRKRFNQHRPEDVYQSPRMIPAHLEAQAEEHSEYQTHDELLEEPVDI